MTTSRHTAGRPSAARRALPAGLALGAAALAACSASDATGPGVDGVRRSVAVASVVELDAKESQISEVQEPGVRVIRSAAEWEAAWAQLTGRVSPAPARPSVNFATQTVVIVALGQRPSGGYGVRADSAWTEANVLSLAVTETGPGPRCMTTAVVTAPLAVAVLGAVAPQVRVVRREVVQDCP